MTAQVGFDDPALRTVDVLIDTARRSSRALASVPVPTGRHALSRGFAGLATAAVTFCTLAIALLHVLPGGRRLNPMSAPISSYALTPAGWLFDAAVIALALGLAALLCALVAGGWLAATSAAFGVLTVCCLGLVTLVVFPERTAAGVLGTAGRIHWIAAMVTFAGLPVAAALLGRRHNAGSGCSGVPSIACRLSVASGAWFAVYFFGSLLDMATQLRLWHVGGVVERVLALTEMLMAVALAFSARQPCGCAPTVARRGLVSSSR